MINGIETLHEIKYFLHHQKTKLRSEQFQHYIYFNAFKTDSDMHTAYIMNLKSKFNFVTYTVTLVL